MGFELKGNRSYLAILVTLFAPLFSIGIPFFWVLLNFDQLKKGLTIELLFLTFRTIGLGIIASLVTLIFSLVLTLANRQNRNILIRFIAFPASIGYAIPGTVLAISLITGISLMCMEVMNELGTIELLNIPSISKGITENWIIEGNPKSAIGLSLVALIIVFTLILFE